MRKRRSVALLLETSNAFARRIIDGIVAYQREHEAWSVYLAEETRGVRPPAWLRHWKGDGIIARIETPALATALRQAGLPTVDVGSGLRVSGIPRIETNDREIATLAGRHLIDRGYRTLAFCGEASSAPSQIRAAHFSETAHSARCACHMHIARSPHEKGYSWDEDRKELENWLMNLPKPAGVLANQDFTGFQILQACQDLEIAVPDEIAVIGVDNDDWLCSACTPPLSSVIPDAFRTGYEAAHLLDCMMHGEAAPTEMLISPLGIAERRSSDAYSVDDEDISAALQFIRKHACQGITVVDILKAVPLSRRVLEYRFQKLLGCTPHNEIVRVRLEYARRLLSESELTLQAIARRTGFQQAEYFSAAFKKAVGVSPSDFRRQASGRGISNHNGKPKTGTNGKIGSEDSLLGLTNTV
jgi:LacI family transcriptional regulator